MKLSHTHHLRRPVVVGLLAITSLVGGTVPPGQAIATRPSASDQSIAVHHAAVAAQPHFTRDVAHDESAPLRTLATRYHPAPAGGVRVVPERGSRRPAPPPGRHGKDLALQNKGGARRTAFPIENFDGISNQDNFDVGGTRWNPPDPNGEVGRTQYVEMVNTLFAVYSKTGQTELKPTELGALWQDFPVTDCTDPSGDPVVLYDQLANRWILTQFTTSGLSDPTLPFYNCVAISKTSDATGKYYRYAFTTGFNFPDYPKYGVWSNSYVATTREFGPTIEYGIGVYAFEKAKMLQGEDARVASFYINGNNPKLLPLVGDGLLPADIDGTKEPPRGAAIPLVGSQDDDWSYGATSDALNVWDLRAHWTHQPLASLKLAKQLSVKNFDTDFPCSPDSRDCLAQPGINDPAQYLDTLATRQRVTFRLAYRNFGNYESLLTNQTVEARDHIAGARWYEVRRSPQTGRYSVTQQSTYSPDDGINRWMGSIAQDKDGNMLLGYSVVNPTNIYPGIRFTGRFAGDRPGRMTLREGIIISGSGVQTSTNSRWGDYTDMTVDPVDDCTFWYVNEYYTKASQDSSSVGWLTRIASIKMPGCH